MDDRRKNLEAFVQQMKSGNPLSEDFIRPSKNVETNALRARNLSEDALANEVLKNTSIPVPDNNAPRLKREDFLNRILKEQYPEMEPDLQLNEFLKNHDGVYTPSSGKILVRDSGDIIKQTGSAFHEGAHKYDDKILNFDGTDDVKFKDALKSKNRLMTDIDPTEAYELMAKGHHARIPDLRDADSFGLGALKSYLKSGKFKQMAGAVPYVGTALAGAAALSSPDASAAVGDALVPGGLESLGPSEDDAIIENPQASPELRKAALERLKNGR